MGECWSTGTATFMIMGDTCTRGCKFCSVKTATTPEALDPMEPAKVAYSVKKLKLDYVVITSVDRDELEDQGANHFAKTIETVRKLNPNTTIEVLTPDFQGEEDLINLVLEAKPEVFGHNVETVPSLQSTVRDFRASYDQSKFVLKYIKQTSPETYTKTNIILGMGETQNEVLETMQDLRNDAKVDIITFGQYLRPSEQHLNVEEYVSEEQFQWYKEKGEEMGYKFVVAGPRIRSSYKAGEYFKKYILNKKR